MSFELITKIESFLAGLKTEFKPQIKEAENEGHAIVTDAASYIKVNGLQDLYQIALAALTAAVPGASWTGILAGIVTSATVDGKSLLKGAEAVVAAQAQADLIAAGKLLPPVPNP